MISAHNPWKNRRLNHGGNYGENVSGLASVEVLCGRCLTLVSRMRELKTTRAGPFLVQSCLIFMPHSILALVYPLLPRLCGWGCCLWAVVGVRAGASDRRGPVGAGGLEQARFLGDGRHGYTGRAV